MYYCVISPERLWENCNSSFGKRVSAEIYLGKISISKDDFSQDDWGIRAKLLLLKIEDTIFTGIS